MATVAAALEPWQAAAPRKRRSATRRPARREAAARGPEVDSEADSATVLRRIREAGEDLLLSDFWSSALETINRCLRKHQELLKTLVGTLPEALGNLHLDSSPDEPDVARDCTRGETGETLVTGACHLKCVCYGIGNFATCVIARNQLTFLLLFLEKCQIPRSHCCVYDPLFSQLEIAVLNTLGVTVLSENEEGKRSICGEPTVFYMLHCGTALYNNLLWSNWSVDALSKMVIIGNSFRGLEERLLTRILQKNYPYIAKIFKGLEELEFPQTPQYTDIFNDTSVHWFPAQKLKQLSADTWVFREEPDYQDCEDLEIIRKKTEDPSAGDSSSL
ncbi:SRR1-like protein [Trichechus manatus latirostris]|uniref:SRR1-like protein n=1 Tax=Trichechus manatus latirostris TaxID=127582 RepID=A0A2Y9E5R2_TRIMA|nr:SRR1-like protein [Trichechus manatus latirostris]